MRIVLCHLWIFALGCSLFGQCIATIATIVSSGLQGSRAPWRIQGSATWCHQRVPQRVPLGVLWCSLSPRNSSMLQPQLVSLTRRFVHIKEQRLLDKAADWNALVRNLKLDKGRSAKGGKWRKFRRQTLHAKLTYLDTQFWLFRKGWRR